MGKLGGSLATASAKVRLLSLHLRAAFRAFSTESIRLSSRRAAASLHHESPKVAFGAAFNRSLSYGMAAAAVIGAVDPAVRT